MLFIISADNFINQNQDKKTQENFVRFCHEALNKGNQVVILRRLHDGYPNSFFATQNIRGLEFETVNSSAPISEQIIKIIDKKQIDSKQTHCLVSQQVKMNFGYKISDYHFLDKLPESFDEFEKSRLDKILEDALLDSVLEDALAEQESDGKQSKSEVQDNDTKSEFDESTPLLIDSQRQKKETRVDIPTTDSASSTTSTTRSPLPPVDKTKIKYSQQDINAAFKYFAKKFPGDFKTSDIGISAASFVISCFSIITIVLYSGTFSVDMAKAMEGDNADSAAAKFLKLIKPLEHAVVHIVKKHNKQLSPDEEETIRITFATLAALDNIAINQGTIENSIRKFTAIINQLADTETRKEKVMIVLKFLAKGTVAGLGAVPTYFQTLFATKEKNWSDGASKSMAWLQAIVTTTMNQMAIEGVIKLAKKLFDAKETETANQIREGFLKDLSALLPETDLISDHFIEKYLSKGRLYADRFDMPRKITTYPVAGLAPAPYVIGAFFMACYAGIMKLTESKEENLSKETIAGYMTLAIILSIFAYACRHGFLSTSLHNSMHGINDIFGDPIVKDPDDTMKKRVATGLAKLFLLVFADSSLTGAEGNVWTFMFKESDKLKDFIASVFIGQGALGTNFWGILSVSIRLVYFLQRSWVRFRKEKEEQNRDLYGKNITEFFKKVMKIISLMDNETMVNLFTKNPSDEEGAVKQEDKIFIKEEPLFNKCRNLPVKEQHVYDYNEKAAEFRRMVDILQYATEEDYDFFVKHEGISPETLNSIMQDVKDNIPEILKQQGYQADGGRKVDNQEEDPDAWKDKYVQLNELT